MTVLSLHSRRNGHIRTLKLAPVLIALCVGSFQGHAQEIGRLYATRPPPGYAFVRVVTATDWKSGPRIQLDSTDLQIGDNGSASPYRAVPGNQPVRLSVDGRPTSGSVVPRAETYLTLAIAKAGSAWTVQAIDEGANSGDGLKAKLRFFNLVPDCTAALRISDGPTIFENADFETVQSRTINPVTAKLESSCGGSSAALVLPQLRAGDYYSIFLRRDPDGLSVTGQLDETEPYRER